MVPTWFLLEDLVDVARDVAPSAGRVNRHLEFGAFGKVGNLEIGVDHAHEGGKLEVSGPEDARALHVDFDAFAFAFVVVDPEDEVLEVEDDLGDVFLDARDGAEFVAHAFDVEGVDARAGKGA